MDVGRPSRGPRDQVYNLFNTPATLFSPFQRSSKHGLDSKPDVSFSSAVAAAAAAARRLVLWLNQFSLCENEESQKFSSSTRSTSFDPPIVFLTVKTIKREKKKKKKSRCRSAHKCGGSRVMVAGRQVHIFTSSSGGGRNYGAELFIASAPPHACWRSP